MKRLNSKGEGYIDVVIAILVVMMMLALVLKVAPVFTAKSTLDTYAQELLREAVKAGRTDGISVKQGELSETLNIRPETLVWDCDYIPGTNKIQIDGKITLTVTYTMDIGFFDFGSFPVPLTAKATGKSEVYFK